MTRSFPLKEKRIASSGVLPIMCFNCRMRFEVGRAAIWSVEEGGRLISADM
jgi:hypothetical protein